MSCRLRKTLLHVQTLDDEHSDIVIDLQLQDWEKLDAF